MSDSGTYSNYSGLSSQLQSQLREDFHGATIRIGESFGSITHRSQGIPTYPTVRSYPDGLRVGCTFVTTEALERLYSLHKAFLSQQQSKTHQ